jgi:hypothetical protein
MYFDDEIEKWYQIKQCSSDYYEFKQQFIDVFTSSVHKFKLFFKLINQRLGHESVQSHYFDILTFYT